MTLTTRFGPVLLLVLLGIGHPVAQTATLSGDLLTDWQQQKRMMIGIAEAMPEETFSFKPTEAQRTYAEQILHIAGANVYLSRHSDPWEWGIDHFTKLSQLSGNDVQQAIDGIQYVKLMRFFPVSEESFPELNWAEAGLQSFRDLVQLVLE